ncbi:holo-ACP synthase AcpS [Corynebacterium frankenforstense]
MTIGTDLVHVPAFAAQLAVPGSRFGRVFTAAERRRAAGHVDRDAHLAGRWAAKEAFIKAWSQALYARPPVIAADEVDFAEVETVADAWHRPAYRLHGAVAEAAAASLPDGWRVELSISHDGDYAVAQCLLHA